MGMRELVGNVSKNGGAAGEHAAFGGLDEGAGKEFAQVLRGGEMAVAGEEVLREVGEVTEGLRGGGASSPRREARGFALGDALSAR